VRSWAACAALRCVPLLDQMGQSAERLLYPPAVAVCPRCIEVSLQSTVFQGGLDCAHGLSLFSCVP
jgi:hypothetical protein